MMLEIIIAILCMNAIIVAHHRTAKWQFAVIHFFIALGLWHNIISLEWWSGLFVVFVGVPILLTHMYIGKGGWIRAKVIPIKRWPKNWDIWHLFSFLGNWPVCIAALWTIMPLWPIGLELIWKVAVWACVAAITKAIWLLIRNPDWPTLTEQWRNPN